MQFNRCFKNLTACLFFVGLVNFNFAFGYQNYTEIDALREDLYCSKSKGSPIYLKNKDTLKRLIQKEGIDYSTSSRLDDVNRLIKEDKLNAAMYELEDLRANRIELSTVNELIADICLKTSKNTNSASYYYQSSLEADETNATASYKLAKLYMDKKEYSKALTFLNLASKYTDDTNILIEIEDIIKNQITPNDNDEANISYETLGQIYYKLNRKKEAYEAYNKAISMNSGDIYAKYYLGDLFFVNDKNDNAIAVYNSILKEIPYDSQIRVSKAKSLAKNGNLLGANREYNEVLSRYPNSMQARYGIYKIYERKLPPNKIMEKVYGTSPLYKASYEDYVNFANFLGDLKDENGKQTFLSYAQKLNEATTVAQNKAQTNFESNLAKNTATKPQKALSKQDVITLKESETKAKQLKSKPSTTTKIDEEAIIARERAAAINKDSKKYKQYKLAMDNYLKIEPKTADTYRAIANTAKAMGEPTSALKYFRQALTLDPTNSDLYYDLGLTYMELNRIDEAKENLIKAINLNRQNTKAINLLGFVNQRIITHVLNEAYSKYEKKEYIEAFEIIDNNLKEYPNNAQLYYYRALIFDAMKRNAASIIDLQKAIELDPSYYMAYYQLGVAYEKIKDERSALVAYERFLSIEPDEEELIKQVQKKVEILSKKFY